MPNQGNPPIMDRMKGTTGIVILIVLCLALGGVLLVRHKKATDFQHSAEASLVQLSNQVAETQARLNEQVMVNQTLETNLAVRSREASSLSNKLNHVSATLEQTEAQAEAAARSFEEEKAKRDEKINNLSVQNDTMTKEMGELNTSLSNLEVQIGETERQLAASEGDRNLLLQELKRLQAEKAELERQFNDLAVLSAQVRKLKDELSIARRLEWIRRGFYGTESKGAARLQQAAADLPGGTNYDLTVEIRQDGNAQVVPPATNAPPP